MPNTSIHALDHTPATTDYIPLSSHQQQTPTTFFHAQAVLHHTLGACDVLISQGDLHRHGFLSVLGSAKVNGAAGAVNGDGSEGGVGIEALKVVRGVKGFVTSESLILFTTEEVGALAIPYPSISLHATQRLLASSTSSSQQTYHSLTSTPSTASSTQEVQAIYLQLSPSDPNERDPATDEDDEETIELFLVPQTTDAGTDEEGTGNAEQVKQIFEALSRCADLHPDNNMDGDESGAGGGLGSGVGSFGGGLGGWITSENMHEFEGEFGGDERKEMEDEDVEEEGAEAGGESDAQTSLGPGAGTRRGAEGEGDEETKWRRTGA